MNLVWHLTKKDLRRLKLPVAGFAAILIAKVAAGFALLYGDGTNYSKFERLQLGILTGMVLGALLAFTIVGLLMHEDALVGTQVAWRTRPISGGMLFRSKLLTLVLLFAVLPVVVALPWWLACSLTPAQMLDSAGEVLAWQAVAVLPAWALAVMTDNFGRYFTLFIGAIAATCLAKLMQLAYLPAPEVVSHSVEDSQRLLALVIAIIGVSLVVLRQFRARGLAFAYGTWSVALVAIPFVLGGWSIDVLRPWRQPQYDSGELTRPIEVSYRGAKVNYRDRDASEAESIQAGFWQKGIPDGAAAFVRRADLTWPTHVGDENLAHGVDGYDYYPGRTPILSLRHELGVGPLVSDPATERWMEAWRIKLREQTKGDATTTHRYRPLTETEEKENLGLWFRLRGDARFEAAKARTTGNVTFDAVVARPVLVAELPLHESDRVAKDGYTVRIAHSRPWERDLFFGKRAAHVRGRSVSFVSTQPVPDSWFNPIFLLRAGTRSPESLGVVRLTRDLGRLDSLGQIGWMGPTAYLDGVVVTSSTVELEEPRVIRNDWWTGLRADWADHATLDFVYFNPLGTYRRTVRLDNTNDPEAYHEIKE